MEKNSDEVKRRGKGCVGVKKLRGPVCRRLV